MKIDTRGNIRTPAGKPDGGQFTFKTNAPPTGVLDMRSEPAPGRQGATLARAGFGEFGMTHLRDHTGPEGPAFSATLTFAGVRVGEVIQDGNGEHTWCRFTSVDAEEAFYRLVIEHWDFDREDSSGGHANQVPHDDSSVLDELYQAVAFRRQLEDRRSNGVLPVLTAEDLHRVAENDHITSFSTVPGVEGDIDAARDELLKRGELAGALYWDGVAWVPLEDAELSA